MSAEQKESSVLFSLKELMNLEEDRIRQEDLDRQRRTEAEARAREEAARRVREEEEGRLRAEEERRRLEEQRKREDQARIEAIRAAEMERQRIEAERRAQLETLEKQQEHARQLAVIQQDDSKRTLRNTLMAVGAIAAIVIFGGLGLYFGKIKPDQEAKDVAQAKLLEQKDEEAKRSQREAQEAQAKVSQLLGDLTQAKDEATRRDLQAKLSQAQDDLKKKQQWHANSNANTPSDNAPAIKGIRTGGTTCSPGDPLCAQ